MIPGDGYNFFDMKPLPRWVWTAFAALFAIATAGSISLYFWAKKRTREKTIVHRLQDLFREEHEFRTYDFDQNKVSDFWTGDVAGLCYLHRYGIAGAPVDIRAIAEADVHPLKPIVPKPVPYKGYLFAALEEDDTLAGTPERFYKVDTGGSPPMGKVHHLSRFGFCAFPAEYGVTGKFSYLINQNGVVHRWDAGGTIPSHWLTFPPDSGVDD